MGYYFFILDTDYYRESHCYNKNGKTICEYKTEVSSGHTGTDAPMTEVPTLNINFGIIFIVFFVLCIIFGMFLAFNICKKADNEKKN